MKMKVEGDKETARMLKRMGVSIERAADSKLEEQASKWIEYSKTKRFRLKRSASAAGGMKRGSASQDPTIHNRTPEVGGGWARPTGVTARRGGGVPAGGRAPPAGGGDCTAEAECAVGLTGGARVLLAKGSVFSVAKRALRASTFAASGTIAVKAGSFFCASDSAWKNVSERTHRTRPSDLRTQKRSYGSDVTKTRSPAMTGEAIDGAGSFVTHAILRRTGANGGVPETCTPTCQSDG